MAVSTPLMTVAEFQKLPEDDGPVYHELRHGELVAVSRPKLRHYLLQARVRDLLKSIAPAGSFVDTELAFRALPEHELRVADVAYVSPVRWVNLNLDDNFSGVPDLVIEIVSPSNTIAELYEKEKLCLENGAQQFWVIDADRQQIKVSTPDGRAVTYRSGQEIPLPFGNAAVGVDAILS